MNKSQKQLIREKFNNEWQFKWEAGDDTREGETNWWLNELDLAIKQTEEGIVKEIEELYIYGGDTRADSGECGEYNRALDDIKKYIYENS